MPKFVTALRDGYSPRLLRADGIAAVMGPAHLAPSVRTHSSECGLLSGNRLVVARHVPRALRIVEALTGDAPIFASACGEPR